MNLGRSGKCLALIFMMQFPFAAFGQEQRTPKKPEQEQIASSRIDTVQLLDYARRLSNDARGLNPVDEITLQALLADTVWPFDKALGERTLLRSFELTIALLKEPVSDDLLSLTPKDPQSLFTHISSIASRHDANLEKKLRDQWQQATASVDEKESNAPQTDPTELAQLLLTQAANYLRSDEQKARQLFRQSVAVRVTQDHYFFLLNQRKRAPEIADTLFNDTIEVLAQRPLSDANEILMLASYLFSPDGSVTYIAISGYNTANVAANMSAMPKNPALAKRYLALLLAKVNDNELVPQTIAYFSLKNLLPQYQIFAPEYLNDVYAKNASLLTSVSKDDSSSFEDAHKSSNASESEKIADWEKRLDTIDKLDKEDWRDFEYFTILFSYLLPKRDFARAALVVSRISNQDLKEKFGDLVSLAALNDKLGKAETASSVFETDCNKIKTPLVRVVALSNLGKARLKQKSTGDALRFFEQAIGEANQIKNDQYRIQAKLMLLQLTLDIDSATAFGWASETFKEINKVSDFDMNLADFSLSAPVYGLKNELPIESPGPSSLFSAVAKMCRINCEETFQTSRLLEKKETRLWANYVAVWTGLSESSRKPGGTSQ